MALPVRHLPVVQNWDCHSCGNCCRELQVPVSEDERKRIEALGWDDVKDLKGVRLFTRGWWGRELSLNRRPDGSCVFLGPGNRCRVHERGGPEAKPLACRLFPFVLAPAGSHWRAGLRFSCPSAAENKGRALTEHATELGRDTRLIEQAQEFEGANVPPPPLQRGQTVGWPDVLRFVQALLDLLDDRRDRVERRLRKCLALANLCRQARFDAVTGGRLVDFLGVVREGLEAEVPADPATVAPPGWVGRLLFRQTLNIYCRKASGENRGPDTRSRLALFRAGWRFARGRGAVPRLNAFLPETTFERVEAATGPLSDAAEAVLARFYLVKVNSLQFCGPPNFGLPFWDGLESLALTFPAALWLARALEGPREQAVVKALTVIDTHFAYNRVFGTRRLRFVLRTLARRGELEKLIAWYDR
jgi:lysine-N-methylase